MRPKYVYMLLTCVVLLLVGYIAWSQYGKFLFRSRPEKKQIITNTKVFVDRYLKSPGTAQYLEPDVAFIDDTSFIVAGVVDAQNGMGGTVRIYYACKIVYLPNGMMYSPRVIMEAN